MNIQHLNIKIFTRHFHSIALEEFIPVFHEWIQKQGREELLLDVADYSHVPQGPGMILIGHQANLSIDCAEGRPGFLYNQKIPLDLDFPGQLRKIMRLAFEACALLQADPRFQGRLEFDPDTLQLIANDRLLAPNAEETFKALEPSLKELLSGIYRDTNFTLHRQEDARKRLTLDLQHEGKSSIPEILERLA